MLATHNFTKNKFFIVAIYHKGATQCSNCTPQTGKLVVTIAYH